MNLLEQFKEFLFSQKEKPSLLTVKNYLADIRHFITWYELNQKQSFKPELVDSQILNAFKIESQDKLSAASIERHLSSLRKFFGFLKLEGQVPFSPFEDIIPANQTKQDPFHLKEFKDFLYVYNASNLTIKNYLIDIKQFLSWVEEVTKPQEAWLIAEKNIFTKLTPKIVEEYKNRLITENVFSPSSINRKLSSLRRYLSWAEGQNLLTSITSQQDNLNTRFTNAVTRDLNLPISQEKSVNREALRPETKDILNGSPLTVHPYSSFPPLRLAQKVSKVIGSITDFILVNPFVFIFEKIEDLNWNVSGKPVFAESESKKSELVKKYPSNISKSIFAPLTISTASFPLHKKVWHHLRHTRPDWYKRYHSYAISHYFNFAILVIFMSILGFAIYQNFFGINQLKKLLAAQPALPQAPLRILSFQGRLTDNSDNPITTATWLRFIIYDDTAATGSARLWEEVRKVTPDQDGIFNVLMGSDGAGGAAALCNGNSAPASPATGACGIMPTLFSQYNQLWLGVTVENTAELAPRQQLATVAFASNSETLQGLPPITQSGAGQTNVVLALDSSGNLTIGGSATPTFTASGGKFTISGNVLSLQTVSGSNSNIQLIPDGSGIIDLQKPLQNTTLNNNINTAAGAVEVDDLFAILATSSGQSALTINQNSTGPLISASTSGVAKFTVDNSGNTNIAGSLTLSGNVLSNLIPNPTLTYSLGDASHQWLNLYAGNIYENGQLLTGNLWQRNLGVLSPANITDDLILGSTSTTSGNPIFAFLNVAAGTPTASISSNLSLKVPKGTGPANSLNLLDGGTLGIYTASSGQFDAGLSSTPALYVANNGNIGIGSNNPGVKFSITDNTGGTNATYNFSGNTTSGYTTTFSMNDTGLDIGHNSLIRDLELQTNSTARLTILGGGNIGIGTTTPLDALDVRGNSGTTAVASTSGKTSFAALVANNDGVGDLFTASSSSNPEFIIQNNGTIVSKHYTTAGGIFYTTSTGVFSQASNASANTVLHGGATPAFSAVDLANDTTGLLGVSQGGTGTDLSAGAAIGDLLYAASTTTFARLADVGTGSCLISGGVGTAPSWGACGIGGGAGFWRLNAGTISPVNDTLDVLIGANSTTSAKFGFINVNNGTPTATISAGTNTHALSLDANGNIQTYKATTLTLGGTTTGNIVLTPGNGTGTVKFTGYASGIIHSVSGVLSSSAVDLSNGSSDITNTLSTSNGGTGQSSFSGGDMLYYTSGTTLSKLTIGTANYVLTSSGTAPQWSSGLSLPGNLSVSGSLTADLIPTGNGSINLGSPSHYYNVVYANSFSSPAGNGVEGFWTVTNNTNLYPTNSADDLLIGGTATNSAAFQIFAQTVTGNPAIAGTASTSGYLTFREANGTNPQINILNGNNLVFKTSPNGQGDAGLVTELTVGNNGDLTTAGSNFIGPSGAYNLLNINVTSLNFGGGVTGTFNIGGASSQININGQLYTSLVPKDNTINLGTAGNNFGTLFVNNIKLPVSGGDGGYWTLTSNVLSPTNLWNDLTIGGTGTGSAGTVFQVFANQYANGSALNSGNVAAGTATSSGNLAFIGASTQVDLLKGGVLGFYVSPGGDAGLNTTPALYIAGNNKVGIQTTSPTAPLDVNGAASVSGTLTFHTGSSTIQTTSNGILTIGGNTTGSISFGSNVGSNIVPTAADTYNLGSPTNEWNNLYIRQIISPSSGGIAGYWQLNSGVLAPVNVANDLAVGGISTGSATFQVYGASSLQGTEPVATISANTSFAALVVDNKGVGDLFSASSSGLNRFVIRQNGNVGVGTATPLALSGIDIEKNGLGNSVFDVNQLGLGDIFTASAGGTPKFVLNNSGYLGLNTVTPQGILDVASQGNLFPSDLILQQVQATNLIWNPSFENTSSAFTDWTRSSTAQLTTNNSTESALFGNTATRFYNVGPAATYTVTSACIPVFGSTSYTLSGYIYKVSGDTGNYGIDILPFTGINCTSGQGSVVGRANVSATNAWTRVTSTVTTASNVAGVEVRFITDGTNTASRAYFDAMQFEKSSSATPYLDGSLGPGYVWDPTGAPNATDSSRMTGSAFAYNTLNSASGIGAASRGTYPTLQLDQSGTGDIMSASDSGTTELRLTNGGSLYTRSFYDLDNTSYFLDPAAGGTSLAVAGSVGIGTTNPSQLLDVTAGIIAVKNSGIAIGAGLGYGCSGCGGASTVEFYDPSNGATIFNQTFSSAYYDFQQSGNSRLRIASGGNVGIGITNPGRTIDVTGNWGGNVVVDSKSLTTTQTVAESTKALMYDLSNNSGANNAVITFNITGVPNTDGTFFIVRLSSSGGANGGAHGVDLTVNGSSNVMTDTCSNVCVTGTNNALIVRTNGSWHLGSGISNSDTTDLAEWIKTIGKLPQPGEIVSTADNTTVSLSSGQYDRKAVGIVSTAPNTIYGKQTSDSIAMALAGRVPAIVTSLNGPIIAGDSISTSPFIGVGMEPTRPTQTVGKALESFTPGGSSCQNAPSYDAISWPADDGTNPTKPCFSIPVSSFDTSTQQVLAIQYHLTPNNTIYIGKIMVLVGNSYVDPQVYLTDTGNVQLADQSPSTTFTIPHYYSLTDVMGQPISRVEELSQLVVGSLKVGVVNSQQVFTDSLELATDNVSIAGLSLHDYIAAVVSEVLTKSSQFTTYNSQLISPIAEINEIHTNLISPLATGSAIAINGPVVISNEVKDHNGISPDGRNDNALIVNGSASIAGTLNTNNLAVNGDATISGTLHANNIEANNIKGLAAVVSTLSAQNITNVTNIIFATPSASPSGATSNQQLAISEGQSATSSSSLYAKGNTPYANIASYSSYLAYVPSLHATTGLFDQGLISLGASSLSDTSIVGQLSINGDLILAQNSVNVLGANFDIQPLKQGGISFEGGLITIDTEGNLTVGGKAIFNGGFYANVISPLPNQDLNVILGSGATPESSSSANHNSEFIIHNSSNSAVLAINQLGDIISSGTASFNKFNLNLVQPALAVSDTEVVATGSAGQASIKPYQKEVTVDNPNVTDNSLIYITPVGTTQTPYLERQLSGRSFSVGIPIGLPQEVSFNWLIVN